MLARVTPLADVAATPPPPFPELDSGVAVEAWVSVAATEVVAGVV